MIPLPKIGITMGDPSGIGPEIIRKVFSDSEIFRICRPIVFGDPGALSLEIPGLSKMELNPVSFPGDAKGDPGILDLMALSDLRTEDFTPASPSTEGGKAMVKYIIKAVESAQFKDLDAVVTCPINKALMNSAGYQFEGHTQLISHLTETDDYIMMLAGDRLRVTLVTIHCALKDVPFLLDEIKIHKTIMITNEALKTDFGLKRPRIAVAALNPHGGESGLFGTEEEDIILPAVKRAQKDGCDVAGPFPSDTLYFKAVSGKYDAVVNMYHDQGLIPLKLLHFHDGVNVTLGLPIIRTSVDHGTAYDIAGKGEANPGSLKAAIRMAADMVKNRAKSKY